MTALLIVAAALLGVSVGSFLNVVIYRVPLKKSIVSPPSACPGCDHHISPRDNVPVLSWLILRGRCRNCRGPISARYPLVEALTGVLFVAVVLRFGLSWTLPAEILFVAGLVALSFIDFDHLLLPRRVVYVVGAAVAVSLVVASAVQGSWHRLAVAGLCAVVEFLFLFGLNWANPKWMGFGDVRFGPVIALALGWLGWLYAFLGFFAANLVGTVIGMGLIASKKGTRRSKVPFGVFLSVGAVLALLFGGAVHYRV